VYLGLRCSKICVQACTVATAAVVEIGMRVSGKDDQFKLGLQYQLDKLKLSFLHL
jgi:hypothetical protein